MPKYNIYAEFDVHVDEDSFVTDPHYREREIEMRVTRALMMLLADSGMKTFRLGRAIQNSAEYFEEELDVERGSDRWRVLMANTLKQFLNDDMSWAGVTFDSVETKDMEVTSEAD